MSLSKDAELIALAMLLQRMPTCKCGHVATGEQYSEPVCDECIRKGDEHLFFREWKHAPLARRHRNLLEGCG